MFLPGSGMGPCALLRQLCRSIQRLEVHLRLGEREWPFGYKLGVYMNMIKISPFILSDNEKL